MTDKNSKKNLYFQTSSQLAPVHQGTALKLVTLMRSGREGLFHGSRGRERLKMSNLSDTTDSLYSSPQNRPLALPTTPSSLPTPYSHLLHNTPSSFWQPLLVPPPSILLTPLLLPPQNRPLALPTTPSSLPTPYPPLLEPKRGVLCHKGYSFLSQGL